MPIEPFAGQPPQAVPTTKYPVTQPIGPLVNTDGSINVDNQIPAGGALTEVVVSFSASGDNTILAGTTGTVIKVYRVMLSSTASTSLTFKSGSTDLSGAIPIASDSPLVTPFDGYARFTTLNGTDSFIINSSATASVGGTVSVIQA